MENVTSADLSPDGKWIAAVRVLRDNANFNVYLHPVEDPTRAFQVTSAGGGQATWRRDGRAFFYTQPDGKVIGVDFRDGQLGAATAVPGVEQQHFSRGA